MRTSSRPLPPSRALRVVVETVPGVFSLEAYFATLFTVAQRLEQNAPHAEAA